MAVRGSSTTSMGSFNSSPQQGGQDPVLPNLEQPLLSTTTITTRSPTINALGSGALSYQEERSPLRDTPQSSAIMIPSPSELSNDNNNDNNNNDDDEPQGSTTMITATTLLLEACLKELRSRSRHLHLLTTGSYFLLPSVLPYLASSLVRHFAMETGFSGAWASSSTNTVSDGREGGGGGGGGGGGEGRGLLPWMVPCIPFLGVVVPIVLTRALNRVQDCRNKRQILKNTLNSHTTITTMNTTTTRTIAGLQQKNQCPSWDAVSRPSSKEEEAEEEGKVDDEGCNTVRGLCHLARRPSLHKKNSRRWVPRSRTILMASLCAWILLLASASHLGLNQPETLVPVETASEGSSSGRSGSCDDSMMQTKGMEEEEEETSSPFATILRTPSTNLPVARPNSWEDEEQRLLQQQQEDLEAMVRAAEEDDVMDSEWVYPSPNIDDIRVAPEEMTATDEMANEEMESKEEEQQQQQQQQPQVIRMFKYVPLATEVFMFLLALCLGGMAVGLEQIKHQTQQSERSWEQQLEDELLRSRQYEHRTEARAYILEMMRKDDRQQRHGAWLWACRALSVVALGLNYWMVFSPDHWYIPSLYFVGLGCAGMLLVHTWVPENDMAAAPWLAVESSFSCSHSDNEKGSRCYSPTAHSRT